MKQRAPWPEPQSSSLGLRVVIGQNSWNKVALGSDLLSLVSDSGAAGGWLSGLGESGWGGGDTDVATSRSFSFFSSSFLGFGVSRGPRTFKWELQNSAKH